MTSIRPLSRGVLAAVVTLAMAGCGTSGPGIGSTASYGSFSSGSTYGASDAQVGVDTNIEELNSSGQLDSLSDNDITSLDNPTNDAAPPVSQTDPTVQDLASSYNPAADAQSSAPTPNPAGKTETKVGIVRSNSNGQFFLQINKGFLWWHTESSLPLAPANTDEGLKIASDLNCKVIIRGTDQGSSCLVRLVFKVPDFSVIWGLFTTGHISGKVYDSITLAGVPNADITVKSLASDRIWRATSHDDGSYSVGQLDPGQYEVDVEAPDYSELAGSQTAVSKMHTTTVDVSMVSQMPGNAPTPQPQAPATVVSLP